MLQKGKNMELQITSQLLTSAPDVSGWRLGHGKEQEKRSYEMRLPFLSAKLNAATVQASSHGGRGACSVKVFSATYLWIS